MNTELQENYDYIRNGGSGLYAQKRGLVAVWGKEAIQFLDGLISNDMKTLEDGGQMLAAFPNAQGRLLAVVRVLRRGDKFLFDTEEQTREKVFLNLFRFTFAGDFFVEDLSENYHYYEIYGPTGYVPNGIYFRAKATTDCFIDKELNDEFIFAHRASGGIGIFDEVHETLRIENGIPKFGADMDETTIVPELGIDGLISYNKGCYIGQEIIARIHFRGHVAKQLTGLIMSEPGTVVTGVFSDTELTTTEGKNAGKITSFTFSPRLEKNVALGFVRYDYLAEGTELLAGPHRVKVTRLPFVP